MWIALWIFVGGGLGSLARWGFSGLIARTVGETFPWGTLVVNITGSFIIGLFFTLTDSGGRWLVPGSFRAFFMLGICGGYTTFSSFSLQTLELIREGDWLKAGANAFASVALCMVAVWAGYILGLSLNNGKRV